LFLAAELSKLPLYRSNDETSSFLRRHSVRHGRQISDAVSS
jgi:hypothetical protein